MKHNRTLISLALALLLASCGGTGTTPAPPVTTPPTTPAPTITSFAATPSTISPGQSSTLSWTVSNTATSLTLTPGVGDVTSITSYPVTPAATTTYTLTATGAGGTVTSTATVTVQGGDPVPPSGPTILYYGEWAWSFDPSGQYDLEQEGRFSITQTATELGEQVSIGTYQECYQGSCNNNPKGAVLIGDFASTANEGLQIIFFRTDSAGDPVLTFTVKDTDGELETDDQGRQVLEGRGQYLDNYDGELQNGTIRAVLIEPTPTFPPLQ